MNSKRQNTRLNPIGQILTLFIVFLICTGSIARSETVAAQQRLMRSIKSGDQAGVWAALQELAQNATAGNNVAWPAQPDSHSGQGWSGPGTCPKIVTIDYPGATLTILLALNNAGEIIGSYVDSAGAVGSFIRKPDGSFVPIDPPGSIAALVWSINESGDVTGNYETKIINSYGYLRRRNGELAEFSVSGAGTLGLNINNDDSVGGRYFDEAGVAHGFVRFPDGRVEEFSAPNAGGTGCAIQLCGTSPATGDSLNGAGDIAGGYTDDANAWHGLLRFRDGKIVYFDVDGAGVGAGQGTQTSGINSRLEIPGTYIDADGVAHGFERFADGYIAKFDVSEAGTTSASGTFPVNINEAGDIAGYYVDSTGASYGFLRYADGRITTFTIPNSLSIIVGYNNAENAIVGNYADANGHVHGFLRTP